MQDGAGSHTILSQQGSTEPTLFVTSDSRIPHGQGGGRLSTVLGINHLPALNKVSVFGSLIYTAHSVFPFVFLSDNI